MKLVAAAVPEPMAQLYSQLESLVVQGNHAECRRILKAMKPRHVPRAWAARFGEISFRVHLPTFTLKVLHRLVYPENPFDAPATDHEKTVYGSALYTFGAIEEALKILVSVDADREPEAWFHMAGANFCAWNYEAGIPFFKKYIQSEKVSPYRRLVGKVNLSAAYIFQGDWQAARELLAEAKRECELGAYHLLWGNCFELEAQIEIFRGNYDLASPLLDRAADLLKDQGGYYSLYVEKWTLVARCLRNPTAHHIHELRGFSQKARTQGHWNTIRECDLFEGLATKNSDLIRKVIFGTPYEPYRKRVRRLGQMQIIAKGQYRLTLGPVSLNTDEERTTVFDPSIKSEAGEALYEKPLLLALYNSLTDDFYHPANLGTLFQRIYPDEKFNPYTSPARVLQLLRRLDTWFADNQYPIRVNMKKSEFSLTSSRNIVLVIQRGKSVTTSDGKLGELRRHFDRKMFSTSDVCRAMGISKASANRLLGAAMKSGKIVKEKSRRGRPYCLVSGDSKRRAA